MFLIYGTPENPLFLAKDVAEWIGHSNPTEMLRTVDEDEKLNSTILSAGQRREVTFLTESGLYEVLMLSRKPETNLATFSFDNMPIRVVKDEHENPWFVAKDICDALGIQNTTQALANLDDDERSMVNIGCQGEANFINQSGLWTLILCCRDAVTPGSVHHCCEVVKRYPILDSLGKQQATS